jgi:hypothetical protein
LVVDATLPVDMNAWKQIVVATLGGLLLLQAGAAAGGTKRPRPSDVPAADTTLAPNGFQLYNDYASPERTYASASTVVHYVVLGIDAPPLNDDDANGTPDYVERVGDAADRALAYYERRGFPRPLPDEGGPDARPDIYVSRFSPGTLGVAFPSVQAQGGAFVVVSNNLDPSPERSFASIYATVAHELFHLVQFAYFGRSDPAVPTWILEGTAAALEARVNPDLDDLVSTIQMRRWFSATDHSMTTQSYGAQLLWGWLDTEQPQLLPALFARLARHPTGGEGEHAVASTYARIAGRPFAAAFRRFAVAVAADNADDLDLDHESRRGTLAPLSVRYLRVVLPRSGRSTLTVRFPRGPAGAAATLVYRVESNVAGEPARTQPISPRVGAGDRTAAFTVSAGVNKSAILVLSNGGGGRVLYAVGRR